MDYKKHIENISYELYCDKDLRLIDIEQRLTNLFELGKNAGKMELNAKHDIKIDQFNPFNN